MEIVLQSYSLNLSTIEHLWDKLKRKVLDKIRVSVSTQELIFAVEDSGLIFRKRSYQSLLELCLDVCAILLHQREVILITNDSTAHVLL